MKLLIQIQQHKAMAQIKANVFKANMLHAFCRVYSSLSKTIMFVTTFLLDAVKIFLVISG